MVRGRITPEYFPSNTLTTPEINYINRWKWFQDLTLGLDYSTVQARITFSTKDHKIAINTPYGKGKLKRQTLNFQQSSNAI